MDRDTEAHDNAEHLYRYLRDERPEINAWFVLSPSSRDWPRLKADGFRLIAYGSRQHVLALAQCQELISSQIDHYVISPPFLAWLRVRPWRFTWLQHGVIKDDLSGWLAGKPARTVVTTTPAEYRSMIHPPYTWTDREVVLTGQPRHDALLRSAAQAREEDRTLVVVMPTWRRWLLQGSGIGNGRTLRTGFAESEFARNWLGLLRSQRVREAVERHGLELAFLPHPNLAPHLTAMNLPDHVRALSYDDDVQAVLARASHVVTDYSSVAFDAAIIDRPILYFQFDYDEVHSGADHIGRRGYFSYVRDGFGPVTTTLAEAESALVDLIDAGKAPSPDYAARVRETFTVRDGHACARVVNEIVKHRVPTVRTSRVRAQEESPVRFTVTGIEWERVHLTLELECSQEVDEASTVSFVMIDMERRMPVPATRLTASRFAIAINVTNFADRHAVPNGSWRLVPVITANGTGQAVELACAGYRSLDWNELDAKGRSFLFNRNRAAYLVSFGISDNDLAPEFIVRTYALANGNGNGRRTLRQRLRKLANLPRSTVAAQQIYTIARATRSRRKPRILFASEQRPSIGGNLKRVHDRMRERGLDRVFDFRYSFRVPSTATPFSTLRLVYLLAISDVVLVDDYFPIMGKIDLDESTKTIQLWHAGSGFKSIGFSRFGRYGSPTLNVSHRRYTYAIAGSTHLASVYAEAFGIEESAVIPTGLPRIDVFLDDDHRAEVARSFERDYPQLWGKRRVLFAPTFRGNGIDDAYYDYGVIDFKELYEACGDEYVVMFRMHHFVKEPVPIPEEYRDRLFDLTSFPDTNDLLHMTDVLVTDYSSIIYEFSLLDRPILFYAYDKRTYAAVRGFHRDFDEVAPGTVCETFEQLTAALRNHTFDLSKIATFRAENFDHVDRGSADRVIDWLILDDPSREAK